MFIMFLLAAAASQTPEIPLAQSSLIGRWQGKLEYRDYQSDKWFGLPVKIEVRDAGDGVTLIRTADYDDGPKTGTVRITTVSMLAPDGQHESSATFRKGKPVELETSTLRLSDRGDATHWTLVETVEGTRPIAEAAARLTDARKQSFV